MMAASRRPGPLHCLILVSLLCLTAAQTVQELAAKEQALRQQLAAQGEQFGLVFELATTLHRLDFMAPNGGKRVPEATSFYKRAIELAPNDAMRAVLTGSLGALLLSSGQLDIALQVIDASMDMARRLGMDKTEVYVGGLFNKCKVLDQLGRQPEAQALLVDVIEATRGVAPATYAKAWASIKNHDDKQLAEMEEVAKYLRLRRRQAREEAEGVQVSSLKQQQRANKWRKWAWMDKMPPADEAWLQYALFAAHDKRKNYPTAWKHLALANKLQESGMPQQHSLAVDEMMLQGLRQMFVPPSPDPQTPVELFYKRLLAGEAGYPVTAPIFVVGLPRSGSTLIEQILASHSQVWGAGEDTALAPLIPSLTKLLQAENGNVDTSEIVRIGYSYVDEMRLRAMKQKPEARWIVDKMLRNAWNIGFIAFMLPKACIIHADRHPASSGLSCFVQAFEGRGTLWATNLTDIAKQVELNHEVMGLWDWVLPGRVLHVRYEDLVLHQEATSRAILEHCNIPWEDGVLDFHSTKRAVQTASASQVRRKMYTSSLEHWKDYAEHMQELLRPLRQIILDYEHSAGLPSSAELLARVLDGRGGEEGEEEEEGAGSGRDEL